MSKKLAKSSFLVGFMTLFSRVFGFIRDIVNAQVFGAVAGYDAFVVAFKIPNFTRRLFGEGAFSQAFVPVLSEYRETKSEEEAKQFMNHMAGAFGTVLLITVLIAEVLAPVLIGLFAPGFLHKPVQFQLATHMLHITLPYLMFISLVAFSGAIMNCYGQFGVPAFTPVLLNISMIGGALLLSGYFEAPIVGLAAGVFIGGVLQFIFQIPFLYRRGLLPHPKLLWTDPGVIRVLKLIVPALFGVSVAQISLLIDTFFASFLREGSISWLYYSDRLTYFPLGIFGVALATVILPHLSRKHADHHSEHFSKGIDWALRCVLVIGLPAAIGLFILGGPIMITLFNYGKFTPFSAEMATQSLMAFSIGLPAFMLVKVLATGFYSRQQIKIPVKIAAIALTANIIFNLAFVVPLAHAGLALATSLAAWLNALLLLYMLKKDGTYQPEKDWFKFSAQLIASNGLMAAILLYFLPRLSEWFALGWHARVLHLLIWIVVAISVYFGTLLITGMRLSHFKSS